MTVFDMNGEMLAPAPSGPEAGETFKESLKDRIAESLAASGNFNSEDISKAILKELPHTDEILLIERLKVFKEDLVNFTDKIKIYKNSQPDEYAREIGEKVASSVNFLLGQSDEENG